MTWSKHFKMRIICCFSTSQDLDIPFICMFLFDLPESIRKPLVFYVFSGFNRELKEEMC